MALHGGITYVRGDYTEELSCESCHMPFATRSGSHATEAAVGALGRAGDTRTHIFRINTSETDYTGMFNEDMTEVLKDENGQAAVTLDYVCLRCHNGIGSAFELTLIRRRQLQMACILPCNKDTTHANLEVICNKHVYPR